MNRIDPAFAAAPPADPSPAPHEGLSFRAFVTTIAALMALTALSIDAMLPAFPAIARSLKLADPNRAQWVLYVFLFGLGAGQLLYGPLADRFGRRRVLIPSLAGYIVMTLIAGATTSFAMLLVARFAQGLLCAAARVLATAIVRDCYTGRAMARVMSLTAMVFMAVPIMAPSVGQAIMAFAPWRWIFYALAALGLALVLWLGAKLPETLHPEFRRPISFGSIAQGARIVLGMRQSLGYCLAMTLLGASMFAYLGSAQQIYGTTFGVPRLFPALFAAGAVTMAVGAFYNASVVERLGMRRVSHSALIACLLFTLAHIVVTLTGHESLAAFALFQVAIQVTAMLANSNFNALAMEPVGAVAGIASSIQGLVTTIGGAALGMIVGQAYDGTTLPLLYGYLAFAATALAIVLVVERGRLFSTRLAA